MNIKLVAISHTNQDSNTLPDYIQTIIDIVTERSENTIFVLPEYCWGDISFDEYNQACEAINTQLLPNQFILLGSYPHEIEEIQYNVAVLMDQSGRKVMRQKTRVLSDEAKSQQVQPGKNQGIVEISGLRVAIIICADMWDNTLLNHLIREKEADLLLVPAFTIVPKGHRDYAKNQWKSLAIVRSREYLIPIAIADHATSTNKYDVGHSTCIVNPSWKSPKMNSIDDFLSLPTDYVAELTIEFDEIDEYRQYRITKGLYQKKSSSDN